MNGKASIDQFRQEVYQSLEQPADAGLALTDTLTSAPVIESLIALSQSPP